MESELSDEVNERKELKKHAEDIEKAFDYNPEWNHLKKKKKKR